MAGECRHCKKLRDLIARGLCRPCYKDIFVRLEYPRLEDPVRKRRDKFAPSDTDRMTAAELDAFVAERYKSLPEWWHAEEARKGTDRDR